VLQVQETGHFKRDYLKLGDDDDSHQFTVASKDYENAGALVVSYWDEEEDGVPHPINDDTYNLTFM
jgi:hypothetical protein